MPELPEVEIVKRGLAPAMEGARFAAVTLNRADLRFPFEAGFAKRLTGERVARLARRAKYILAEMESGLALAMHLGMTGRFTILSRVCAIDQRRNPSPQPSPNGRGSLAAAVDRACPLQGGEGQGEGLYAVQSGETGRAVTPGAFYYGAGADPRHDHVEFQMSTGDVVRYNDVRRFGYMTLFEAGEQARHPLFKGLGVEPLSDDLTPAFLARAASGKKQALKSFLLDQRVIAGLGNIYVCEALFRARLPPEAPAGALAEGKRGAAAAKRLCGSVKRVLEDALEAGGSSIRDYRHADGAGGAFQEKFDVYGRRGEPCHSGCGALIERKAQQGRSTFFCPRCQSKL